MPHDANNEILAVGDIVSLDCRVTGITPGEEYCNVTLEAVLPPNPPEMSPATLTTNSRQVIKTRAATNATADVARETAKAEPESQPAKPAISINR